MNFGIIRRRAGETADKTIDLASLIGAAFLVFGLVIVTFQVFLG
jgi:hypothetical protein